MDEEERSRDARARAELALLRLVYELRDEDVFLTVLGGLVPDVLARDDALIPEHLGEDRRRRPGDYPHRTRRRPRRRPAGARAHRLQALAADLGFSERQLRRRFLVSVGCGPKILQRVLRLRRFLASQRHDLARAALDAGYADQPHLARECLRLTGLTPSQLP